MLSVLARLQYSSVGGMEWRPAGASRDRRARHAERAGVMAGSCYLWQLLGPPPVADGPHFGRWPPCAAGRCRATPWARTRRSRLSPMRAPRSSCRAKTKKSSDIVCPLPISLVARRCYCSRPTLSSARIASQYPNTLLGVVVAIATQTSGRNSSNSSSRCLILSAT